MITKTLSNDNEMITKRYQKTRKKTGNGAGNGQTVPPREIPDWLSAELWESFVVFRKEKKAPLSDHACELAFSKLDELRKAGHDPAQVIEESILNGWKGLFAPTTRKSNGEGQWWASNAGIDAKGREIGLTARGGENYESYKARIFEEMKAQK